jgi:error-prone DNA polymerase
MKLHYPAAFCAALLNAQPMGFYSPNTLIADARRHGVLARRPDVNESEAAAHLQPDPESTGGMAVRLGIGSVRGIGDDLAKAIEAGRPYASMEDLVRRTGASKPVVEALATAGAFDSLDVGRRPALWAAGATSQVSPHRLEGIVTGFEAPALPGMSEPELLAADLWATGVSTDGHPVQPVRGRLDDLGAIAIADLERVRHRTRVLVGGIVTHRQRPATAGGIVFVNLEDETGILNVICREPVWAMYRRVARGSGALLVRGMLERVEGVTNLVADRLERLSLATAPLPSRDFR